MIDTTSRTIDAEGLALHLRERPGPGPRVLFLHGWLDHGHSFDPLCELLPRDWHLALLDFRGMGRSAHVGPGATYNFGDYLLDAEHALNSLGWQRAHLVAHSLGGVVAVDYAAARPERVASLCLIEALGNSGGPPEKAVERARDAVLALERPLNRKVHPSVEVAAARLRETNPTMPEAVALHLTRHGVEPAEGGVRFTFDPRHRRRFALAHDDAQILALMRAVKAPARLIIGDNGMPLWPDRRDARLAALRVDGPHVVPGGHHVHLERPREVAALVAEWIERTR